MAGCEADSHVRDASTESGASGVTTQILIGHPGILYNPLNRYGTILTYASGPPLTQR